MTSTDPSPAAVLFLAAIDPASGHLVKRRRLRFRKALKRAHAARGPGAATRARRAAIIELRSIGFIKSSVFPWHYPLIAGSGATRSFARLRRGIDYGFESPLDRDLFVLLAWSGILASRLSRSERTSARKRLTRMMSAPPAAMTSPEPIDQTAWEIGEGVYRQEVSELRHLVHELLTDDGFSFDLPGGHVGDQGHHHAGGHDGSSAGYGGGGGGGGSAHAGH